jgi:hypothetical protein
MSRIKKLPKLTEADLLARFPKVTWPATMPVLAAEDMCRLFHTDDCGRHSLEGHARFTSPRRGPDAASVVARSLDSLRQRSDPLNDIRPQIGTEWATRLRTPLSQPLPFCVSPLPPGKYSKGRNRVMLSHLVTFFLLLDSALESGRACPGIG